MHTDSSILFRIWILAFILGNVGVHVNPRRNASTVVVTLECRFINEDYKYSKSKLLLIFYFSYHK